MEVTNNFRVTNKTPDKGPGEESGDWPQSGQRPFTLMKIRPKNGENPTKKWVQILSVDSRYWFWELGATCSLNCWNFDLEISKKLGHFSRRHNRVFFPNQKLIRERPPQKNLTPQKNSYFEDLKKPPLHGIQVEITLPLGRGSWGFLGLW